MKSFTNVGLLALMARVVLAVPHPAPVANPEPQLFITLAGQPETLVIFPDGFLTPISVVLGPTGVSTIANASPTPLSYNPGGPFKNYTASVDSTSAPSTAATASLPVVTTSSDVANLSVTLSHPVHASTISASPTLPVNVTSSTYTSPVAPISTGGIVPVIPPISPSLPSIDVIETLIGELTTILQQEENLEAAIMALITQLESSLPLSKKRELQKRQLPKQ